MTAEHAEHSEEKILPLDVGVTVVNLLYTNKQQGGDYPDLSDEKARLSLMESVAEQVESPVEEIAQHELAICGLVEALRVGFEADKATH